MNPDPDPSQIPNNAHALQLRIDRAKKISRRRLVADGSANAEYLDHTGALGSEIGQPRLCSIEVNCHDDAVAVVDGHALVTQLLAGWLGEVLVLTE